MSRVLFLSAVTAAAAGVVAWRWLKQDESKQADTSNGTSSSSSSSSGRISTGRISINPTASFIDSEYHISPGIITCASLAQLLTQQAAHPSQTRLIVLDASWFLPMAHRDPETEFRTYRIKGASFWDIDRVADTSSGFLPHMLPSSTMFENMCYQVGIRSTDDRIVCYDTSGAFCGSARLWWNFRCYGWPADRIHVLHGGMKEMANEFPEWIDTTPAIIPNHTLGTPRIGGYQARFVSSWYRSKQDILSSLGSPPSPPEILVDARDAGRFTQVDPEPRSVKYRGHIPGALNLFHGSLLALATQRQRLKSRRELEHIFKACLGFSVSNPPPNPPVIVNYCGSGVTASTVAWALFLMGYPEQNISVYDGSWVEWGNDDHVPIE